MNEHTSYELSKRLHELGFKGEHTHVWVWHYKLGHMIWGLYLIDEDDTANEQIPAYTFTELWAVLPYVIKHPRTENLRLRTDVGKWLQLIYSNGWNISSSFKHASPAECAGLMLEWLITNNHVKGE